MSQNSRNTVSHTVALKDGETPRQTVERIVTQVLKQLMSIPEVADLIKRTIDKLQAVERNLDGPLTHSYLEQLTTHNRVYTLIG